MPKIKPPKYGATRESGVCPLCGEKERDVFIGPGPPQWRSQSHAELGLRECIKSLAFRISVLEHAGDEY